MSVQSYGALILYSTQRDPEFSEVFRDRYVMGFSRGHPPAFRTEATSFVAPSLPSPPIVATVASPNIASASTTSSFSDGGRARCRCLTRTRNRRQKCSICESRIPADRCALPAAVLQRVEPDAHTTSEAPLFGRPVSASVGVLSDCVHS
jgi:hypothetical protein